MNISRQKFKYFILSFLVLIFSKTTLATSAKSTLQTVATPLIAVTYSLTISDYEGVKELVYASLVTAQLTTLIKNSVRRTRPNGDNDLSFPSGHAAGAFVGASYAQFRYGWHWGVPMYAIASAVAVQRVNGADHYWTDVIAGAALGTGVAYFFTRCYPNAWVVPEFNFQTKSYGLQFKYDL